MPDSNHKQSPAVRLRQAVFAWPRQSPVLCIDDFSLGRGEHLFLCGPSGSGKSTLLGLIGGVLQLEQGELEVLGTAFHRLRGSRRDGFRAAHIGYIFQQFNLLPYLSVTANVLLPCRFAPLRRQHALQQSGSAEQAAQDLLEKLGLEGRLLQRPVSELSVGQQQRVAAARALIGAPELVIADEPTSSLDHATRERFLELLLAQCRTVNAALLFVSHDTSLAACFDRRLELAAINSAAVEQTV